MKIKKIVLDLDDVLNDFSMSALKLVGCEVKSSRDFDAFDPAWGYDIIKAANGLIGTKLDLFRKIDEKHFTFTKK
ncbi:hypothetical protein LCGC14_3115840, partial [marine sediment metagenome]